MPNIFITGIDINVGKTYMATGLAATMQSLGYQSCVYKPIQMGVLEKNGFVQAPDPLFVKTIDPYVKTASSYLLKSSDIPLVAAENENIFIDCQVIKKDYEIISKDSDCVIVENTGAIMTPISRDFLAVDMIKALDVPVLILLKPQLGAVSSALLTINHAIQLGVNIRGVVINNFAEDCVDSELKNLPRLIEEYTNTKILGIMETKGRNEKVDASDLITDILNGIDIESVFDLKIAKLEIE